MCICFVIAPGHGPLATNVPSETPNERLSSTDSLLCSSVRTGAHILKLLWDAMPAHAVHTCISSPVFALCESSTGIVCSAHTPTNCLLMAKTCALLVKAMMHTFTFSCLVFGAM